MGILDKLLAAIKLNDDYDDEEYMDDDLLDDEEDFLDDEDEEEKPKKKFFDKFTKKKSVDEDDEEDFLDEEEEPKEKAASKVAASRTAPSEPLVTPKVATLKTPRTASSKITPMRSSKRNAGAVNMEVCVIKPSSMEDAREIADTLVQGATVILNLEGIDVELAQRIIDFTSGSCYSLGGSLQKVSSYIFLLGPHNVDITGDLQNILGGSTPSVRVGY